MDKTCLKCNKIKPLDDFPLDPVRNDGHHPYCNECQKKYHRELYRNKRELVRACIKRWSDKNPEKVKIYGKVQWALKIGKLTKPKECQVCGVKKPLSAHHWHGYDEKHILDVQWICIGCHNSLRAKEMCGV